MILLLLSVQCITSSWVAVIAMLLLLSILKRCGDNESHLPCDGTEAIVCFNGRDHVSSLFDT